MSWNISGKSETIDTISPLSLLYTHTIHGVDRQQVGDPVVASVSRMLRGLSAEDMQIGVASVVVDCR